jgi:hypothetical protein
MNIMTGMAIGAIGGFILINFMNLVRKFKIAKGGDTKMRKSILALLFTMALMAGSAFAAPVSITATVGNENPTVGDIQLCNGTCGYDKSFDPPSQFTVQVTISDPNGQSDLDLTALKLEWYVTADSNGGTPDWDAKALTPPTTGTRDGCIQSGTTYCLQVDTTDWTEKFLSGAVDVYVYVEDQSAAMDSNEAVAIFTVNNSFGTVQDTTSGTYTGAPDTPNNAFSSTQTANAYIISTHNGNVNIEVTAAQTDLTYLTNTIGDGNMSWYLTNDAVSSTPFTGGEDKVETVWSRGTDPTSAASNLWMWIDIPAGQVAGAYTGTLTYGSSAS